MASGRGRHLVTLGMFIIDEFSYSTSSEKHITRITEPQIGGGGTYATIGARMWLPPDKLGMIVDRGNDFPPEIQEKLDSYGPDIWLYRDHESQGTTRALNSYKGEERGFKYLTPRIRLTPADLEDTKFARPSVLHFICSPTRAGAIMSEVVAIDDWSPTTVYEPIPQVQMCTRRVTRLDRHTSLDIDSQVSQRPKDGIPSSYIPCAPPLTPSPNAEEALSLLSLNQPVTKAVVEHAAARLLEYGVGVDGNGSVIIRSGHLGAYVVTRKSGGKWVDAYWTADDADKVVDVTGAGNSFLGGLSAGLLLANDDVYQATLYGAISASYVIEQQGLPNLTRQCLDSSEIMEVWNGDLPKRRLEVLERRIRGTNNS